MKRVSEFFRKSRIRARARSTKIAPALVTALSLSLFPGVPVALADQEVVLRPHGVSPELYKAARRFLLTRWRGAKDILDYRLPNGQRLSFDDQFDLGSADLNGDGIPELFIEIGNPLYCGSGGCHLLVLQKQKRLWRVIMHDGIRAGVFVLDATDFGYHRLCTLGVVEAWDGKHYWPMESGPLQADQDEGANLVKCDDGDTGMQP